MAVQTNRPDRVRRASLGACAYRSLLASTVCEPSNGVSLASPNPHYRYRVLTDVGVGLFGVKGFYYGERLEQSAPDFPN